MNNGKKKTNLASGIQPWTPVCSLFGSFLRPPWVGGSSRARLREMEGRQPQKCHGPAGAPAGVLRYRQWLGKPWQEGGWRGGARGACEEDTGEDIPGHRETRCVEGNAVTCWCKPWGTEETLDAQILHPGEPERNNLKFEDNQMGREGGTAKTMRTLLPISHPCLGKQGEGVHSLQ